MVSFITWVNLPSSAIEVSGEGSSSLLSSPLAVIVGVGISEDSVPYGSVVAIPLVSSPLLGSVPDTHAPVLQTLNTLGVV